MNIAYNITGTGKICAFIDGKPFTVDTDHCNYDSILASVRAQDWEKFVKLADIAACLNTYMTGDVKIQDGAIFYAGEVIHNSLTQRILTFMKNDLPFEPLLKFLDNLLKNPSCRAVNELYDFLEVGELPITEDGCFLAFKNVRSDFKDIHSGTKDNSIGQKPSMPRNMVDEDKNRTCSTGLHFCSIKYLPHFRDSNGGHTMILKINPADVVAIPADYQNTKGRASTYEVVAEYMDDWRSRVEKDSGFDSLLYSPDGEKFEGYVSEAAFDSGFTSGYEDASNKTQIPPYAYKDYDDMFIMGYLKGIAEYETDGDDCDCSCDALCSCCTDDDDTYGTKPSGQKFYNKRDAQGHFIKKQ